MGKGTWFVRALNPDTGKYDRKSLGNFGAISGNDTFNSAKRDAEQWAQTVETGGVRAHDMVTVEDACMAYLQDKPCSIAQGILRRHIFSDKIAKVKLDNLRRHHLADWRKRLEQKPAMVSRSKRGPQVKKNRALSTVNRDMVPLRAALSRVLTPGPPSTDAAWQEALKPHRGADKRRELYLDRDERKRLLSECSSQAQPFVRALCLLPLRPGALANLTAGDFDARTRTLTVGKDKTGKPRQISLPQVIADFINIQVKEKLPGAPIFSRDGGKPWDKDAWKGPIKSAVHSAGLPMATSAYTLRHSVITDLVRARLPILTVAQLSGTSVVMIERHYGHLVHDDAEDALATLAL